MDSKNGGQTPPQQPPAPRSPVTDYSTTAFPAAAAVAKGRHASSASDASTICASEYEKRDLESQQAVRTPDRSFSNFLGLASPVLSDSLDDIDEEDLAASENGDVMGEAGGAEGGDRSKYMSLHLHQKKRRKKERKNKHGKKKDIAETPNTTQNRPRTSKLTKPPHSRRPPKRLPPPLRLPNQRRKLPNLPTILPPPRANPSLPPRRAARPRSRAPRPRPPHRLYPALLPRARRPRHPRAPQPHQRHRRETPAVS